MERKKKKKRDEKRGDADPGLSLGSVRDTRGRVVPQGGKGKKKNYGKEKKKKEPRQKKKTIQTSSFVIAVFPISLRGEQKKRPRKGRGKKKKKGGKQGLSEHFSVLEYCFRICVWEMGRGREGENEKKEGKKLTESNPGDAHLVSGNTTDLGRQRERGLGRGEEKDKKRLPSRRPITATSEENGRKDYSEKKEKKKKKKGKTQPTRRSLSHQLIFRCHFV